jgi:membrane protein implicated in regulation of membrane protease activity
MLIVALVLAVIGLAALVTAVVTSNELIAWVCIGASAIGVVLLIIDAVRERSSTGEADGTDTADAVDTGDTATAVESAEDYPDDVGDETPSEDEAIVVPRSTADGTTTEPDSTSEVKGKTD